jgi:hypothetical protein
MLVWSLFSSSISILSSRWRKRLRMIADTDVSFTPSMIAEITSDTITCARTQAGIHPKRLLSQLWRPQPLGLLAGRRRVPSCRSHPLSGPALRSGHPTHQSLDSDQSSHLASRAKALCGNRIGVHHREILKQEPEDPDGHRLQIPMDLLDLPLQLAH